MSGTMLTVFVRILLQKYLVFLLITLHLGNQILYSKWHQA